MVTGDEPSEIEPVNWAPAGNDSDTGAVPALVMFPVRSRLPLGGPPEEGNGTPTVALVVIAFCPSK
jgi:hypothetical protein